jgi:N-acetylglucosaminyldiphosphoundecaprenol N-acetyl-beta-D-mannosaminyltransferase
VSRRRLRLGRLEVDALRFEEALDAVEALVARGDGGAVFTPNVDHVVLAEDDPAFREAYAAADLALADGMPLVWASRLLPVRLPERVAGADLVVPLLARAAARRWSVFVLGGAPGSAAAAAAVARGMGVEVCGVAAPAVPADPAAPDPEGDAAIVQLREAGPGLVLVGFGAPKQELWIHRRRAALAPAVAIAVGAGIDFLAGRVRRAPPWVARAGLEWAWRLAAEPRRLWRRYLLRDPRFALVLARELARARLGGGSAG